MDLCPSQSPPHLQSWYLSSSTTPGSTGSPSSARSKQKPPKRRTQTTLISKILKQKNPSQLSRWKRIIKTVTHIVVLDVKIVCRSRSLWAHCWCSTTWQTQISVRVCRHWQRHQHGNPSWWKSFRWNFSIVSQFQYFFVSLSSQSLWF